MPRRPCRFRHWGHVALAVAVAVAIVLPLRSEWVWAANSSPASQEPATPPNHGGIEDRLSDIFHAKGVLTIFERNLPISPSAWHEIEGLASQGRLTYGSAQDPHKLMIANLHGNATADGTVSFFKVAGDVPEILVQPNLARLISRLTGADPTIEVRHLQVNRMRKGDYITAHADHNRNGANLILILPLPGDYEGGDLYYRKQGNRRYTRIQTRPRTAVLGKIGLDHYVKRVRGGTRKSLAAFLRAPNLP